jgi:hypothetical protein
MSRKDNVFSKFPNCLMGSDPLLATFQTCALEAIFNSMTALRDRDDPMGSARCAAMLLRLLPDERRDADWIDMSRYMARTDPDRLARMNDELQAIAAADMEHRHEN